MRPHLAILACMAAGLLFLAACGGEYEDQSADFLAGGGIGGTGKGTVTGYGSVIVNDSRHFAVDAETRIEVDGEPVSESELRAAGIGLVVRVRTGADTARDFSSGTATEILADHLLIGPVTDLDPLRVLGQVVVTTGDTVLPEGTSGVDLETGTVVAVSGYADAENTILATRLELRSAQAVDWLLTGPVANLHPGQSFSIGPQWVEIAGVVPRNCEPALHEGMPVKLRAAPQAVFGPGVALKTVYDLECVPEGLEAPGGEESAFFIAEAEGLVHEIALPRFDLDGQEVLLTDRTGFLGGKAVDLVAGAKVEAEGVLDRRSGVLTAHRVRFREKRVRIEAPVTTADGEISAGTHLEMIGIPVEISSLTRIEGGSISLGTTGRQIEMRGFVDSTGRVFATRLRDRGDPEAGEVKLRGAVTDLPGKKSINILGVDVDTNHTAEYFGPAGEPLTRSEFLSLLRLGSQVNVDEGRLVTDGDISGAESLSLEN